jgi:hypothetical protein
MQAVVRAAHAQAAEEQRLANEEEAQRKRTRPDQAVRRSSRSLPRRARAASNGSKLPLGTALPTWSPPSWSNADDDTSPLPRLTASADIASPPADGTGVGPDRATKPDGTARSDRASKRDRTAAKRERAAQQERERAEPEHRVAAAVRAPTDLLERPQPSGQKVIGRRRYRPATLLIASALVLVAGGSLAVALSAHSSKPTTSQPEVAPPALAVAWVADQVSRTATVACDPVMCRALRGGGVDRLLVLGPRTTDPQRSQVIIATAVVREEFGASLSSAYAPSVIASFGSGNARIDIRLVARYGPAAYQAALNTDLQNRKQAGADLLGSSRVVASATARRQMLDGDVTSQLLIVITNLASLHTVSILSFGGSAPGASPGIPLRSAELAETGTAAVQQMLTFLHVQRPPYLPALIETIRLAGKPVLLIEFAAPTPLGLLAS